MSPVELRIRNYSAGECQQQFHSGQRDKKMDEWMDGLDRSVSEGSQSHQAVKYGNGFLETWNHK
jgi:hypothetical protein